MPILVLRKPSGGAGTPTLPAFVDQTGVALSTVVTSAGVTLGGGPGPWSITSSGGTFDINGSGTFISSGTVSNGDVVRARVTSSGSNSTTTDCIVTVNGSVTDTFSVTTLASAGGFTFASGWSLGAGSMTEGQTGQIVYAPGGLVVPTDPRPERVILMAANLQADGTYSVDTSPLTAQSGASWQSTVTPPNSPGAGMQVFPIPGNDANLYSSDPPFNADGSVYINVIKMWDYDNSGQNDKEFRGWTEDYPALPSPKDTYTKQGDAYITYTENNGIGYAPDQHGGVPVDYAPFPASSNTWYVDEWRFKDSSVDVQNGVIDKARNGGWAYGAGNRAFITCTSDSARSAKVNKKFFLNQISNFSGPAGSKYYYGAIYVSKGFRLIASSESTYRQSRSSTDLGVYRIPQLPVANSGSANGLTALWRSSMYGAMNGLYLYLVDENENAVAVGRWNP